MAPDRLCKQGVRGSSPLGSTQKNSYSKHLFLPGSPRPCRRWCGADLRGLPAIQLVEQFAERTGITEWWIGKANREDLTPPVAVVHETARALGLVSVRKGRLTPTVAASAPGRTPALW
jgi:hypothetical protein